jgi:crystallin, alpha B
MLTAQRIPISLDESGAKQWDWPLQHNDGVVKIQENSDNWEVELDMSSFEPKEIEVN